MHDGPDRTLRDEWTIPMAVAKASAGAPTRFDVTSHVAKKPRKSIDFAGLSH
jgi:hypothetical protein